MGSKLYELYFFTAFCLVRFTAFFMLQPNCKTKDKTILTGLTQLKLVVYFGWVNGWLVGGRMNCNDARVSRLQFELRSAKYFDIVFLLTLIFLRGHKVHYVNQL